MLYRAEPAGTPRIDRRRTGTVWLVQTVYRWRREGKREKVQERERRRGREARAAGGRRWPAAASRGPRKHPRLIGSPDRVCPAAPPPPSPPFLSSSLSLYFSLFLSFSSLGSGPVPSSVRRRFSMIWNDTEPYRRPAETAVGTETANFV